MQSGNLYSDNVSVSGSCAMCTVDFYINFHYIRKLALSYYTEIECVEHLHGGMYLRFLERWAAEHDCVRIGIDILRGSEEAYLLLKLKGIAMTTVSPWEEFKHA